jgi:hypothetical protein
MFEGAGVGANMLNLVAGVVVGCAGDLGAGVGAGFWAEAKMLVIIVVAAP